jgi:hypothetical protein
LRIGRVDVIPQLLEALAQEISDVQAGVGLQKAFEICASVVGQVFAPRQQHVALTFDVASILAGDAFVFRFANRVDRVAEMFDDVKLVEHDRSFRRVTLCRNAERLPHVHHGKPDFPGVFLAEKGIEQIHVGFRPPGPPNHMARRAMRSLTTMR